MTTSVVGVHLSPEHTFTKQAHSSIELVAGVSKANISRTLAVFISRFFPQLAVFP
jgi:hypothetical protein